MRTAAILGPSYCGSTVLSQVLNGLPGVAGVGETHHVLSSPEHGLCATCGVACPVFVPERLQALKSSAPSAGWYREFGRLAGATELVVTSDKHPSLIERCASVKPDMVIFPLKDPRAHVLSLARHEGEVSPKGIQAQMGVWCDVYEYLLNWSAWIPSVSISMESLSREPQRVLKGLCEWLGVPFDAGAIRFWERAHHMIAGNVAASRWHSESFDAIDFSWASRFHRQLGVDDRWRAQIPDLAGAIIEDERIRGILAMLESFELDA